MNKRIIKNRKNIKNQQGISVLLAILILSSLTIMAVTMSDVVLRTAKGSRQIGQSETAYYAAESAVEKALYEIEKNRSTTGMVTSGTLAATSATWTLSIAPVLAANPLTVSLNANQSYQVDLDFTGSQLVYPTSLTVTWNGTAKVLVLNKVTNTQTAYTATFVLNNVNVNRYMLRIVNGPNPRNFTLSSASALPVGIVLTGTGVYKDTRRVLEVERTNWKIY